MQTAVTYGLLVITSLATDHQNLTLPTPFVSAKMHHSERFAGGEGSDDLVFGDRSQKVFGESRLRADVGSLCGGDMVDVNFSFLAVYFFVVDVDAKPLQICDSGRIVVVASSP
jgi:hypothetical protein